MVGGEAVDLVVVISKVISSEAVGSVVVGLAIARILITPGKEKEPY